MQEYFIGMSEETGMKIVNLVTCISLQQCTINRLKTQYIVVIMSVWLLLIHFVDMAIVGLFQRL